MPNDRNHLPSNSLSRDGSSLERLAEMLDCPVEALSDGESAPPDLSGVSELLTIWVELDRDADRKRLLEFARQLAALQ